MADNRSATAAKNVGAALGLQLVTVILGFVLRAAFARSLGAEMVGLNAVLADLLALLSMAELGLSTAMAFSYLQPIAAGDSARLASLNHYYRRLYRYISIGIFVLGLAGLPVLRLIVRLDPIPSGLEWYYLLLLTNTALSYSCTHLASLITAYQQGFRIVRGRTLVYLVQVAFQLLALLLLQSYAAYLVVQVLATGLVNLYIIRQARRFQPQASLDPQALSPDDKALVRRLLGSMGVYKAALLAFSASTTLLISVLFGTAVVGAYAGYAMLVASIAGFVNAGFASATTGLGDAMISETPARRAELFGGVQTLAFMIAIPVAIVFQFAATTFVTLWLGPQFALDDGSVAALSVGLYLTIVLQPIWIFREATGMYRRTKWLMLLAAVLNISLAVLLARTVGLAGVFIAPVLARLFSYFAVEPVLLFREHFEERARGYFLPIAGNTALLLGLEAVMVMAGFTPGVGWGPLVLTTSAVLAGSSAITLLLYSRSAGFRVLRQVVRTVRS